MQSNQVPQYTRVNQMPCSFDGCGRRQAAKGLCAPHYKQRAAGNELKPVRKRVNYGRGCLFPDCKRRHVGMGFCGPHLKQHHAGNGFGPVVVRRARRGFTNTTCVFPNCGQAVMSLGLCAKHRSIRQAHDLTDEQIVGLFSDDRGCAICGDPPSPGRRLHIDHDHACCPGSDSCGRCVRGLLCSPCNTGVGHLRDNVTYLRAAVTYLENYKRLE